MVKTAAFPVVIAMFAPGPVHAGYRGAQPADYRYLIAAGKVYFQ